MWKPCWSYSSVPKGTEPHFLDVASAHLEEGRDLEGYVDALRLYSVQLETRHPHIGECRTYHTIPYHTKAMDN